MPYMAVVSGERRAVGGGERTGQWQIRKLRQLPSLSDEHFHHSWAFVEERQRKMFDCSRKIYIIERLISR